ncbi:ABC transporter ATP-binding protein [Paenibacillus sp. YN15]|uniref:ABC transporter ATP-binding protein n=1 Tax=Paenibacillus sp. YN15 TaxID=1742774 RepID=UPI000DCDF154|nr:ABC transporter ATP-binding protein [Paenibacillus sp. YN15]RAU97618.1 ABC transporter ATP-binding protein [Paenibacillus sp. YN15]
MIEAVDCFKSYDGAPVLQGVSLKVAPGEIYGIIGPNGSGKSTLLRLISGVERADAGTVRIEGRPAESYSRRKLAQLMAVLEQEAIPPVGFTVRQVVEMGRFPHQDWLGRERSMGGEGRGDSAGGVDLLLDQVMERLGLSALAERTLDQVSGGERQRTALGKAMAQEPRVLLLDEPTTYLDIGYQLQMMDYVSRWNRENWLTVVAVLHDLNLAAQYCHRLLVLHQGRIVAEGAPAEIMDPALIGRVYGTVPAVVSHPVSGIPQILLQPEEA